MADGALDGIKEQSSRFSCYFFKLSGKKKRGVVQNKTPIKAQNSKIATKSGELSVFIFFFSDKEKKALTATSKIATQSARDYELNILLETQ